MITDKFTKSDQFSFHWRCKKTLTTHLSFADDLLLFCYGNMASASILKAALDKFSELSDLQANHAKSQIFTAGVHNSTRTNIQQLFGFPPGQLPVRYLGVPLISTKLRGADCRSLVDRMLAKVKSWT